MKKLLLFAFAILSFSLLAAEKVYYSDGSYFLLEEVTSVKAEIVKKHELVKLKKGLLKWSLGEKTVVIKDDGTGNMPVFMHKNVPFIEDVHIFWRGDVDISVIEKKYGVKLVEILPTFDLWKFRVLKGSSVKIAEKIVESGDGFAYPDLIREQKLFLKPEKAKDEYFDFQWHLKNRGTHNNYQGTDVATIKGADIKFEEAFDFLIESGVDVDGDAKIAVMDSGVAKDHEDLQFKDAAGEVAKLDIGYDALDDKDGGNPDLTGIDGMRMDEILGLSHGTNCAGVSAAQGNDKGMSGVCPWCGIYPVRFLSAGGSAMNDDKYYKTFERILADPSIVAINCSFGPAAEYGNIPISQGEKETHLKFMRDGRNGKGGAIVYASGNDGTDAAYNGVLKEKHTFDRDGKEVTVSVVTVGASTAWDTRASYSNFGKDINVIAPSLSGSPVLGMATTGIPGYGDYKDDYSLVFSGTSAAAPVVTGFFGTLFSVNPDLTIEEAIDILHRSADKVNPDTGHYDESGHSVKFGYGRVNLLKAVRLALGNDICESPAETDACGNNIDDNCDGKVDEGCSAENKAGESCESDADCVSGDLTESDVICLQEFGINKYKGGYCALRAKDAPCPDGTILTGPSGSEYCLKDCAEGNYCERSGYTCSDKPLGVCIPQCSSDEDCLGDSICNALDRCQRKPAGIGGACDSNDDCSTGSAFCVPPAYLPGGYCLTQCAERDDSYCSEGAHCLDLKTPQGSFEVCLGHCDSDEDCRPEDDRYVCHSLMQGKEGVCFTKCSSDSECDDENAVCSSGKCVLAGSENSDGDEPAQDEDRGDVTDSEESEKEDSDVGNLGNDSLLGGELDDSDDSEKKSKKDDSGCSCSVIM